MRLRTTVRDCLYLNWAFPVSALPDPPDPLRYQRHSWEGRDHAFGSVLLFRQEHLRITALPLVRLSYAQLSLRLNVVDDEGVPSVWVRSKLVPLWVLPLCCLTSTAPARAARFRYPRPIAAPENETGWSWVVERGGGLSVRGRPGAPHRGAGPELGSFDATVTYFRKRPRGYSGGGEGRRLRRVDTELPPIAPLPLSVEVEESELLRELLPLAGDRPWPEPHSAWLCHEMPLVVCLAEAERVAPARQVPAPG